ncbi:MAG: hypothetical protein K0S40_1339, partial [Actinomycetospora sp.]|nr:hypothetical protein [Actinomycetospora sp.]
LIGANGPEEAKHRADEPDDPVAVEPDPDDPVDPTDTRPRSDGGPVPAVHT